MSCCPDEPTGEGRYVCRKYEIRMHVGGLRCRDPEIYCKFRSACAVYFMTHRRGGLDDDPPGSDDAAAPGERTAGGSIDGTN